MVWLCEYIYKLCLQKIDSINLKSQNNKAYSFNERSSRTILVKKVLTVMNTNQSDYIGKKQYFMKIENKIYY